MIRNEINKVSRCDGDFRVPSRLCMCYDNNNIKLLQFGVQIVAQIVISSLPTGICQATDETPATDPLDTTEASTGTTKKYIRSDELNFYLNAQGLTTYSAVIAATTGALTATYSNGTLGVGATLTNAGAQIVFATDDITPAVASRILVKNEVAPEQNGIYTLTNVGSANTNWVLTRATDYDSTLEVIQYGLVLISQGTTLAGQLWQETGAGPFTIGTTAIVFSAYNASSSEFIWSTIADTSLTAEVNNGYVVGNASQTTVTLPATAAVGDRVSLRGYGSAGWILAANTGQVIIFGDETTTSAGSLTSSNRYDSVDVDCIVADLVWTVSSAVTGGLTYA